MARQGRDQATARWTKPILTRPDIRRDTVKVLRGFSADRSVLAELTEQLSRVERRVLIAWATEDRVMPLEHGHRLADLFPRGYLVEIDHSHTLVLLDQLHQLSRAIRETP